MFKTLIVKILILDITLSKILVDINQEPNRSSCVLKTLEKFSAKEVLIYYFDDFPSYIFNVNTKTPVIILKLSEIFYLDKYLRVDFYFLVLNSSQQLKQIAYKVYRRFQPHTKTIILYNGYEPMREILKICLEFKLLNVLLINNFEMYTYFPYKDGACFSNYEPEIIGHCNDIANITTKELYPDKVPLVLNGCEFRIFALTLPPYVMNKYSKSNPGLEIRVLRGILERINLTYIYVDHKYDNFGFKSNDGNYTGVYNEIFCGHGDIMLGMLRPNSSFIGDISFTVPYATDQITWHVPSANEKVKWRSLSMVFTTGMWLLLLATVFCTAVVSSLLARNTDRYRQLNISILATWGVLLQISLRKPKSTPLRISFISWVLTTLLVVTAYTSKLISVLTQPNYEDQLQNEYQLIHSNLSYGFYHSARDLFNEPEDPIHWKIYNSYTVCPLTELNCINRTAYQRDFAVLKNRRQIRYFLPKIYVSNKGRPMLYTFKKNLFYYPLVFATIKGHPLLERINDLILRMQEDGVISQMDADLTRKIVVVKEDKQKPLEIEHLEGIFILYLIGGSIGIFVFVLEHVFMKLARLHTSKKKDNIFQDSHYL